jgi:hypothetical protein
MSSIVVPVPRHIVASDFLQTSVTLTNGMSPSDEGIYLMVIDVANLVEGAIVGVLIPHEAFDWPQRIT